MARIKGRRGLKGKGKGKRGRGGRRKRMGEEMIVVRLMGEGQYYIDRDTLKEVNKIDNGMVKMLVSDEKIDEYIIKENIAAMRMLVKSKGKRVKDDIIIPSHIIIPTTDISVEEAREAFKGEGIVPEGMLD